MLPEFDVIQLRKRRSVGKHVRQTVEQRLRNFDHVGFRHCSISAQSTASRNARSPERSRNSARICTAKSSPTARPPMSMAMAPNGCMALPDRPARGTPPTHSAACARR